jgi:hypothetical protein
MSKARKQEFNQKVFLGPVEPRDRCRECGQSFKLVVHGWPSRYKIPEHTDGTGKHCIGSLAFNANSWVS